MQSSAIRIGTRGSPLALRQAQMVRDALAAAHALDPGAIEIVPMRTSGDRLTDRPLAEFGGKGLFTKEIDEALLDGRVDIGVHSAKDMATRLPDGIVIAACLPRADVRDALIAPGARTLDDLPSGAVVGTSSLRRRALLLRRRPDLTVVDLRGNVDTRLRRIAEGRADATLLAAAGLVRLGLTDRIASFLDPETWIPAPGQGVVAIAARAGDDATRARAAAINDITAATELTAERAFLAVLDGSCRTPIGGLGRLTPDRFTFRGIIVSPDGKSAHDIVMWGKAGGAERIGTMAGRELAERGGPDFFAL